MAAPLSTDEFFDRIFSRPVARLIVKAVAGTRVTPNQLTGVATVCGVATGVALGLGWGLLGAACLLGYLAFDCADGQLARLRGGGSYLGRAMDGVGDYVSAVAIHVGLALWLTELAGSWLAGWTLSAAAGLALIWASFCLDRYKRRYRGDTDDLVALRAEAEATGGLGGWFIARLEPYAHQLDGGVVVTDAEAYQARVRLPMALWLLGGPTTHFLALTICLLLGRPDVYAWIAIGPMLLLTLVTLVLQVRLESRDPPVLRPREPGDPI